MSEKKKFNIETEFYNWLEKCPLSHWQTISEHKHTDHIAVTVKFKIPKKSSVEPLDDYRGMDQ